MFAKLFDSGNLLSSHIIFSMHYYYLFLTPVNGFLSFWYIKLLQCKSKFIKLYDYTQHHQNINLETTVSKVFEGNPWVWMKRFYVQNKKIVFYDTSLIANYTKLIPYTYGFHRHFRITPTLCRSYSMNIDTHSAIHNTTVWFSRNAVL